MPLCGSLEKDTDRMRPSSPRQTWSSNLKRTASQLFQLASQRADQRGLLWIASKRLASPFFVVQNQKSLLEILQQLCYLIFVLIHVTVQFRGTHTFKTKEMSSVITVSPTRTTSTWMHAWYVVVILCNTVTSLLRPRNILFRLFKCRVISTIKARSCIQSEDWHSKTGLPFFFIKFSISSRK